MTGALAASLLLLAAGPALAGRFPIGLCGASAVPSGSGFDSFQPSPDCGAEDGARLIRWRPAPKTPPGSLADELDLARGRAPQDKPVRAVLQVSDKRVMDFSEIRFMSYLAVMHGAEGIFYSSFIKPDGTNLLDHPEEWQALARVARELKSLQGVLEGGRNILPPFAPNPDELEARAWRHRGRDYVLVLNRYGPYGVEAAHLPEELLGRDWRPLFEVHRDPCVLLPKAGSSCALPAYRAMVFEGRRRWSWRNLLGLAPKD